MRNFNKFIGKNCEVSYFDRRNMANQRIESLKIVDVLESEKTLDSYVLARHIDLGNSDAFIIGTWDIFKINEVENNTFVDIYTEIFSRVISGAKWLNKHEPGWQAKIDLEKFDITDGTSCIIGQVLGNYENIWLEEGYGKTETWAQSHGFDVSDNYDSLADSEEYSMLQEAWLDYLRAVQ